MKEFALIFRVEGDFTSAAADITPAQMQERMTHWSNWMGSIAARDRLSSSGHRLGIKESKTVASGNVVTDGPYTEVKEFINGFIIVKAQTVDEAVEMAKGCPILFAQGGKVEVRPLVAPDDNK
ncbi:MAG TPA: YciI family protein [Puia sp.]|nr:YciI family protein [Puia sp.]